MSRELLDAVQIQPDGTPQAAVIWLHGLGADGHDFPPMVPALGIPMGAGVRYSVMNDAEIAGIYLRTQYFYDVLEADGDPTGLVPGSNNEDVGEVALWISVFF